MIREELNQDIDHGQQERQDPTPEATMKTGISDLTAHLFAQLERMSNADLNADQLEQEVKRTDAIVDLADRITSNADLQLKAAKLYAEHGNSILSMLPQIGKSAE